MKIAVSGKGGTGKTTITGGLARAFADEDDVVSIDLDPSPNLITVLGGADSDVTPLSEMDDLIKEKTGVEPGSGYGQMFKLNFTVDDILERYGIECNDRVQLLVAGSIKKGGSGCFCPENALVRRLMEYYLKNWEHTLLMDMEAGVEHLGRGTTQDVDVLLIVVEPNLRSVQTAERISNLAEDLDLNEVQVVLNKVRNQEEKEIIENKLELPIIHSVPHSEEVIKADLEGVSVYDKDGEMKEEMKELKGKLIEL